MMKWGLSPFDIRYSLFVILYSRWLMRPVSSWTSNAADPALLQRCKKAITNVVRDAQVILYGSRARGDAHEYSDYDILILVDGPVDMALEEKMISNVYPLELETGAMLTLIVYSTEQWNSPLYRAMPFHKNVDREGVML
jgi:predicted nucleotidyltransferase